MAIRRLRLCVLVALFVATADGSSAVAGTFPGRNGVLVFDAVDRTTRTVQIFQVSAGGTGLTQLTTTTGDVWNEDPTFSATGRTIYFDSLDRATTRPSHIFRMNANGTGRKLADGASAPTHVWPSVNRSGSALAVVQYGNRGESSIATMKTNGANRKTIANATRLQSYGAPEYSPSGGRLAFYRVTYNENGQGIAKSGLFVRDGTRNTNITARHSGQFFGASWAPNGRTLVVDPRSAHDRLDEAKRYGSARTDHRVRGRDERCGCDLLTRRKEDRVPPVHRRLRRPRVAGPGLDLGHERERLRQAAGVQRREPGAARQSPCVARILGLVPGWVETSPPRSRLACLALDLGVIDAAQVSGARNWRFALAT